MMNCKTPLEYFRALSAIPRTSGNEKEAADFVEGIALTHGCTVLRDSMHNMIIKKEASPGYENAPAFMIQGHLDMVGEAAPGVVHDFLKDPIRLVQEGDILRADGTTLGGDDGVAVAIILALITEEELVHPPLEFVLTVQEETGLYGALALDTSGIRARTMLNLDAGPEGVFVTTCAGGGRVALSRPVKWEKTDMPMWNIKIFGLSGGHSGAAISKQGGNALVIAGQMLDALRKEGARPGNIRIGDKDNVIPAAAEAQFAFEKDPADILTPLADGIRECFLTTDPSLQIGWERCTGETVLVQDAADALLDLMLLLPHGVMSYSTVMPGLVETSSNLAVAKTYEDHLELHLSLRSSSDLRKEQLIRRIERLAGRFGAAIRLEGVYPGWSYAPKSMLRDKAVEVYKKLYGKEPEIQGIHAGLECGVIKGAIPDMDILATGPLYGGMHTPDEWMSISGLERTCRFVKELVQSYAIKE